MSLKITVNYCDGCHIKIECPENRYYKIVILDGEKEILNLLTNQKLTSCNKESINFKYVRYTVKVYYENNEIFSDTMNLKGKKVKINFDSHALGDCIAWMGQVDRFQKIHNCELYVSCIWKDLFEKTYSNIKFQDAECLSTNDDTIIPGLRNMSCKNFFCFYSPCNCYYASFDLGFYSCYPSLRNMSLSEVASSMLGMDYIEERPKIYVKETKRVHERPYVCIAIQSTGQYKYWNNTNGWLKVVDYLNSIGYDVLCIDKNDNFGKDGYINSAPRNVINKTGDFPLQERITDIINCDFFIGLSSGLSWLAWGLKKPVIMVSGFTHPEHEFKNPYRVFNKDVCNSCWHDEIFKKDKWSYCPKNKNYECSTEITPEMVIEKINLCIRDNKLKHT